MLVGWTGLRCAGLGIFWRFGFWICTSFVFLLRKNTFFFFLIKSIWWEYWIHWELLFVEWRILFLHAIWPVEGVYTYWYEELKERKPCSCLYKFGRYFADLGFQWASNEKEVNCATSDVMESELVYLCGDRGENASDYQRRRYNPSIYIYIISR